MTLNDDERFANLEGEETDTDADALEATKKKTKFRLMFCDN